MANKMKIEQLDNSKLVELFKKNGYGEFEEVLHNNGVTGKNLFDLKEFEIMRWKLPPLQRRKLWSCLTALKEKPQNFLGEPEPEKKQTINRKQSMLNTQNIQIKEKLELVIGGGGAKTFEKNLRKPEVKVSPSTPPVEDYLPMDKPMKDEDESHYDDNGYLLPTAQEAEENDYEPPPTQKKVAGFVPSRYRDIKKPIGQRAPQALPRNEDSEDYISGPDIPTPKTPEASKIPNTVERREAPKVYPKVQKGHRIPPKSIRTPSPIKVSNLPNPENEDVEETYEPAPHVTSPTYANEIKIHETQDNGTITKKLTGFLLNKLGKKSNYEDHERKWHSLNLGPRDKSPTGSMTSLEKDVALKDRPLPPLPWEMEANAQPEIYQNIHDNPSSEDRPPSLEAVYSNHELENDLAKQFAQRSKYSYEHYRMSQNTSTTKKLPGPPNTLPTIPLNPQILSTSQEEEPAEYNNAIFNLNDEPYYRNTDRKGAKLLLHDLEDGAFLIRPSKRFFLTLTVKYGGKYCNLGIEKSETNKIRLNTDGDMSPEFATLRDLVSFFTREDLTYQQDGSIVEVRLKMVLPHDRF